MFNPNTLTEIYVAYDLALFIAIIAFVLRQPLIHYHILHQMS